VAVGFFSLWGAALGAAGAGVFLLVARFAPASVAALAAALFWLLAARLDRKLAGVEPPILSRIVVALLWFQALRHLDSQRVLAVTLAAHTVSRAAVVVLAWASRPSAKGWKPSSHLRTPQALLALVVGLAAAALTGLRAGLVIVLGTYLILRLARAWCYRSRGGIDGPGLAAAQQLTEVLALMAAAFLT
jgi:cobalamin synthase